MPARRGLGRGLTIILTFIHLFRLYLLDYIYKRACCRRNASIRTREGWGLLKFRVVFTLGVRIHLHVEALLGEPVPASWRARRELGLLFLGRPARWVLPFTASPLPPPLRGQPIQCLSCSRRSHCEEALEAKYPSNPRGWHPQGEAQLKVVLFPQPSTNVCPPRARGAG